MYDNIGGKIKGLAKAIFIIGAVVSFIAGIVLMFVNDNLIFVGVLIWFIGIIVSWVSSWVLYGFGEIIDKISDIERNTQGGEMRSKAQSRVDSERISKIEKLRLQGLITEEEYKAQRAEIISKL